MEAIEMRSLLYFFLVSLIIPMTLFGTKSILRYESITDCINRKSNECSFQFNGYEKQSYFVLHPNNLCYLRIFLTGGSLYSYFIGYYWVGVILFFLAAATDFVDGMVARSCNLETGWGKILDPLCDKIFYFPYFFYFAIRGFFSVYIVALFLVWDLGIGQIATRKILIYYGFSPKSKKFGKTKTIVCTICLALCFVSDILQTQIAREGVGIVITVLFYSSLILSVLSVFEKMKGPPLVKLRELLKKIWQKNGVVLYFAK
jgi:CDP-diacylglycerol--glycerol-3-phosphate 3-phosphatidyltransferase